MSPYDWIYRRFVIPNRGFPWGRAFLAELERVRETLDQGIVEDLAASQLNSICVHAATTSKFWKQRFSDCGIDPHQVRGASDLSGMPILEKSEVRDNLDSILSAAIPVHERLPDMTGGSTGAPLRFYRDSACLARRVVHEWVFFRWYQREPWHRWAHIWGAQRDLGTTDTWKARLRSQLVDRAIVLPGNRLSPNSIDRFVGDMKRFRPEFIHGYSQAVFFVAKYLRESGTSLTPIRAITLTAEPISIDQKHFIENVFGCPVFSIYGTREFGMLAAEAPQSTGMHVNPLNALIELVRPDGAPANPGEPGQVVITDLLNRATPLIRYRIGDIASALPPDRSGGKGLPRLELSAGRETDFVLTPDHRYVSGASLTLISSPSIAQLQYHQRAVGHLEIRYVKAASFNDSTLQEIRSQIQSVVGNGFTFEFSEVEDIPLLPSGKFQYVHSEVARQSLGLLNTNRS